jgi:hypothetical protein
LRVAHKLREQDNMKKIFLTGFIILGMTTCLKCQDPDVIITQAIIVNGDTVPIYVMKDVHIYSPVLLQSKHDAIRYSNLVTNVKEAYRYAHVTAAKVDEMNLIVAASKNERERKKLMKKYENELRNDFEQNIKHLSKDQGIILIKLIDRETGNSSYDLIKEFRGKVMATFYQTLGSLFGYNLKMNYDPNGEDKEIEQIVKLVENGSL